MGDAMSHAVFPGVVVAYIIGIPFAIGAFITGLFCAVATGFLDDNSRIKRDTIVRGSSSRGCSAPGWCCTWRFNPRSISTIFCLAICWEYPPAISGKRR